MNIYKTISTQGENSSNSDWTVVKSRKAHRKLKKPDLEKMSPFERLEYELLQETGGRRPISEDYSNKGIEILKSFSNRGAIRNDLLYLFGRARQLDDLNVLAVANYGFAYTYDYHANDEIKLREMQMLYADTIQKIKISDRQFEDVALGELYRNYGWTLLHLLGFENQVTRSKRAQNALIYLKIAQRKISYDWKVYFNIARIYWHFSGNKEQANHFFKQARIKAARITEKTFRDSALYKISDEELNLQQGIQHYSLNRNPRSKA